MDDTTILTILAGIFFGSCALVYTVWFGCIVVGGVCGGHDIEDHI